MASNGRARVLLKGSLLDEMIAVSRGTKSAPTVPSDGPKYADNARVPAEPWTTLGQPDVKQWLCDKDSHTDTLVKLLHFPIDIIRIFRDLGFCRIRSLHDVQFFRNHAATQAAIDEVIGFVKKNLLRTENDLLCLGLSAYRQGMKTVSYDHHHKCRVGLHVDDWDDLPIDERKKARNVLVLNLGESDRHFLFMDIPIERMVPHEYSDVKRSRQILAEFLRNRPDYPVLKLRVPPGWAYVAPTGRLVHDGSNENSQSLDVHLGIVGHFR